MTINPQVLQRYTAHYSVSTFIETGTFEGSTTLAALEYFKRVYTVELLQEYFDFSRMRFEQHGKHGKVIHQFQGDSSEFLYRVLPEVGAGAAFIYLDAHYSGFGPVPDELPLWGELRAIKASGRACDIIAIDDIRLCGKDYPGWKDATVQRLAELLLDINPNYLFSLELGVVPCDVLVAHD